MRSVIFYEGLGNVMSDMKRSYEAPTVEKIRFNYRDQVVAASGGVGSGGAGQDGNSPSAGEQFIGRIAEGLGFST